MFAGAFATGWCFMPSRAETTHEEGVQRDDDCFNQRIGAGQLLHRRGVNSGVAHDARKCRRQQRCVEDHQDCSREQNGNNDLLIPIQTQETRL